MNANDQLKDYHGSESVHKYLKKFFLSAGAKALADKFECYWFLDIIVSYQYKVTDTFQVWTLTRKGQSATVICTDGNDNIYVRQHIPFTDFKPESATLWVEHGVILLPSEH